MGGVNLHDLDVKLVKGDFADPEGYRPYMEGAYGVFINTDCECITSLTGSARYGLHFAWVLTPVWSIWPEVGYDTPKAIATEIKYGGAILAECARAGIQHVVYSGLTQSCETTPEMYSEACFTSMS